ncbi:MAG: hypothetical protein ACHQ1G_03810, partial [Planctomycetota bacterium]
LLRRVPERSGWRLDLDWKAGIEIRVDLYVQLSDARQWIVARVESDSVGDGRTERAAEAAVLLLALGAKCRGPYLIGYLVTASLASDTEEILRIAMRRPGFDAAAFRRIVDPVLAGAIQERGPPRLVIEQERTFMIGAVEAIAAGTPPPKLGKSRPISFLRLPDLYREAIHNLDVAEKAIARADTTPEGALGAAKELSPVLRADDPIFGDAAVFYSRAFRNFADRVADLRLTRVAMALLEHRQRKGAWPLSLVALGEMPLDPYSGGPFLYERTEGGCRVHAADDRAPDDLEEERLGWTFRDDQLPAMAR